MKNTKTLKRYLVHGLVMLGAVSLGCSAVQASPLSMIDSSWIMFADDSTDIAGGGQNWDTEYLFYKMSGDTLSIGLQSGFNLDTGIVGSTYAGDLALSFHNLSSGYDYAFDFGSADGDSFATGLYKDAAGWTSATVNTASDPVAMTSGTLLSPGGTTYGGSANNGDGSDVSYWRTFEIDLEDIFGIGNAGNFQGVDVHWTMSCGNDAIDGTAPVPEPATMLLFGTGLAGLIGIRRRKSIKK